MTAADFEKTLNEPVPDANWSVQAKALWYDGKGQWKEAHDLIDQLDDRDSAHIHAYLHRVEGDLWNARYWYNRAKQPEFTGSLAEEWKALVERYTD